MQRVLIFALSVTAFVSSLPLEDEGSRIVGGEETTIDSLPYMVALKLIYNETYQPVYCGASALTEKFILSAAHCFYGLYENFEIQALAGVTDTRENPEQMQVLSDVVIHSNFSRSTLNNDIAIAILTQPFDFGAHLIATRLPENDVTVGSWGTVSGWGWITANGPESPILKKLQIEVFEQDYCKKYYKSQVTENMFCAGYKMGIEDSCKGDSGGPLMINGIQQGIVSFGHKCALPNYPGIYTRVFNYLQWINDTMEANNSLIVS